MCLQMNMLTFRNGVKYFSSDLISDNAQNHRYMDMYSILLYKFDYLEPVKTLNQLMSS